MSVAVAKHKVSVEASGISHSIQHWLAAMGVELLMALMQGVPSCLVRQYLRVPSSGVSVHET